MAVGKKFGGREKGTPNKRTSEFRERLDALCAEKGYDLIGSLVETARGGDIATDEPAHAMTARKLLTEYAYPKLKALEHTVVEPVRVIIRDDEAAEDLLS